MNNILDMAMQAFSGQANLIEAIAIAVICALLVGRFIFVIIWAVIAVLVDTFLPVVYTVVSTGNTSGIAAKASEIVTMVQQNWTVLAVKYVVYLIAIAILVGLKGLIFRRG